MKIKTKVINCVQGVSSPTLANMVLDELAEELGREFKIKTCNGFRHHNKYKINLVRYADDFVVTGANKEVLENRVKLLPILYYCLIPLYAYGATITGMW